MVVVVVVVLDGSIGEAPCRSRAGPCRSRAGRWLLFGLVDLSAEPVGAVVHARGTPHGRVLGCDRRG